MRRGANVPLGYDRPTDPATRALVVNEPEAEQVRLIFRRYAELGSVSELERWLHANRILSKAYLTVAGRPKRVTPHVLRHSAAMALLQAGVDVSVIALWLGHESVSTTQVYLHAHLALKEAALAKVKPFNGQKGGRYKPSDRLLAFLDGL